MLRERNAEAKKRMKAACGDATVSNRTEKDKPTLTTLPPEIKNIIYFYALCRAKTIIINKSGIPHRRIKGNADSTSPNLLRTCKIIHREARPMFYGGNHFIVPANLLGYFLSAIKVSSQHLTNITFELNDWVRDDREKFWHEGFVRLTGLVEEMVRELRPIVANMKDARSDGRKAWTMATLAKALTFSVTVKRPGTRWGGLNLGKQGRDEMGQEFPGKVHAGLIELTSYGEMKSTQSEETQD